MLRADNVGGRRAGYGGVLFTREEAGEPEQHLRICRKASWYEVGRLVQHWQDGSRLAHQQN